MARFRQIRRAVCGFTIAVLTVAVAAPALTPHKAYAAQVGTRSIQMSTSQISTAASYIVSFKFGTAGNVQGIVVDFCAGTPIIGDTTCANPTGMTVTAPTVSGQTNAGGNNLSTFTTIATKSNGIVLTAASAVNMTSTTQLNAFTIATGIVNPSTVNQAFYARIYTYATSAAATAYTVATPGAYVDAGGLALSTAAQITITSKVQERLTFCVYTTGTGNDCTTKSGTAVTLGDTNGVLDPSGPFVDKNAKYSISTNASGNAVVNVKGGTLTDSASDTITATGASAVTSAAGTEQFGLCTYESAAGTSTLTPASPYNNAACTSTTQTAGTASTGGVSTAQFAFDTTNTSSTYGQTIATKPAGSFSTGTLVFLGNISNSTEAGIYTTTLTFIATGTY